METVSKEKVTVRSEVQKKIKANGITTKFPKYFAKKDLNYEGSFQEAVGSVLLLAEFFAIMPVKGITSKDPRQLSFSWINLRALYSMLFIVASIFTMILSVHQVLGNEVNFDAIEPFIFNSSIIISCVNALFLAKKWSSLMSQWREVERSLPEYRTSADKRHMARSIKMVTLVALMLSLVEHILFIISKISYIKTCPKTGEPFKDFFLVSHPNFFHIFPYSIWSAWLVKIQNVIATFVWTYMDVFVMIVSIGLSSKFKQLNDNLHRFKGLQMPETFWTERRIQYRNLCILCGSMDNAITVITMVSYSNNLYFICVQLLRSLNKMPSVAHGIYFYYSLAFLFGRAMAVSLYTAGINDESRKPLRMLRCVPKESWCLEVKRFSDEISSDFVALTGMKFFHLTRKLILSVAGTIVTYELVLIQFYERVDLVKDCSH